MKKTLLLLLCLLSTFTFAQQRKVEGKVVEEGNNEPLIGATVSVKGSPYRASLTDVDGFFSIRASTGETLEISYVGFKTVDVKITESTSPINVALESNNALDAVVVVGYGTSRKRDVAGAISSIKTDDVKAGIVTSTAQMLQGRAAGVQVRTNNAEPGGGISVRVRGSSSISSNNEPLYVIDGFQTTIGNQINPADIESMEILKDAASTAIYGARGANGVVIITTKRGKDGKFMASYDYSMSVKSLFNPWNLMDAQDYMNFGMATWRANGSQGNPPYTEKQLAYKGPGTDWLKETTRQASTQTHQINIAGGSKKLKMGISANYLDDLGVLQNTAFNRFSSRLNLDYELTDRVRFGANAYVSRTFKNYMTMGTNSTDNNMIYAILMSGPFSTTSNVDIFGEPARRNAIVDELNALKFENINNTVYATIYGDADILSTLNARVNYTYSNSNTKQGIYYPKNTNVGKANNGLGTLDNLKGDTHQLDAVLTYKESFWDKFSVKGTAGSTLITYLGSENGISARGFSTDAFSFNNIGAGQVINSVYSSQYGKTNISAFVRGEFVYDDKYILNASYRADGASNFGAGNKWGYFPAASFAWQVGDEEFMSFITPVVNNWKLRASYGLSGNDGIGSYLSLAKFAITDSYLGGASAQKGYYPSSPANPNLKWETTSQLNIGTDLMLFNSRIEVTFDYYVKTTTDLLNPIQVSISTGGFSTMMGNNGKIENRGAELFVRSTNIAKPNFSWTTTLNLARNKNTVLELNNGEARYTSMSPQGWYNWEEYALLKEGYALSSIYGYIFDGIVQTGEKYSAQPSSIAGDPKFKDLDGDGIITPKDRQVIGDGNPTFIFGLGNNLRIYDFDLSFFFDGCYGNQLLNISRLMLEENGRLRESTDRWTQKNPSNTIPARGYRKDSGIKYGSYVNSNYVEDASYLRLQNIEVGYNLPVYRLKWDNVVKGLRLFVGAQNLFTLTKYTGFSPETSTNGGSAVAQGLDYNSYPAYKTINFGAKITF